MTTTELKPFLVNLADEESNPDEDGVPTPPDEEGGSVSEPSTEESGNDGFGLDEDMIEAPGVEEF